MRFIMANPCHWGHRKWLTLTERLSSISRHKLNLSPIKYRRELLMFSLHTQIGMSIVSYGGFIWKSGKRGDIIKETYYNISSRQKFTTFNQNLIVTELWGIALQRLDDWGSGLLPTTQELQKVSNLFSSTPFANCSNWRRMVPLVIPKFLLRDR